MTYDRSVVYSTNKTDHHDITEILLTVALNTINLPTSNSKSIINSINIYVCIVFIIIFLYGIGFDIRGAILDEVVSFYV